MLYQFNIALTEADYLAFNNFHSFDSNHSKKAIQKVRLVYVSAMAVMILLAFLILGWTSFSLVFAGSLGTFTLFYMLMFQKIMEKNMETQIKRMKKIGKLPYEAVSTMEFHEEHMAEISPTSRTEESYANIERICVLKDRYIFLYRSSVSAYILPLAQIKAQADPKEFLSFLSQKCNTVEYY